MNSFRYSTSTDADQSQRQNPANHSPNLNQEQHQTLLPCAGKDANSTTTTTNLAGDQNHPSNVPVVGSGSQQHQSENESHYHNAQNFQEDEEDNQMAANKTATDEGTDSFNTNDSGMNMMHDSNVGHGLSSNNQQQQQQQQLSPGLSLLQAAAASSPPPHSYRHSRAYRHFKNPPQPHMCIRTTTETGEELFINVLSWTRIVIPQEPSDPIPLYGGMRVSISFHIQHIHINL